MNLGKSLFRSQLVIQVYSETDNPNGNCFHSSTASHHNNKTVAQSVSVFYQSKITSIQTVKVTKFYSGFKIRSSVLQQKETGTNSLCGSMKVCSQQEVLWPNIVALCLHKGTILACDGNLPVPDMSA